ALGLSLLSRAIVTARRARIAGAIVASVAAPMMLACAVLALAARDERLHRREAVVVAASARVSDSDHRPLSEAASVPEAGRLELVDSGAGWGDVRWAAVDGWVPSTAVRDLAREASR